MDHCIGPCGRNRTEVLAEEFRVHSSKDVITLELLAEFMETISVVDPFSDTVIS